MVLDESGGIWTWGISSYGLLGDGTSTARYNPKKIAVQEDIKFKDLVMAGRVCVVKDEQRNFWTWGSEANYLFGDGTKTGSDIPIKTNIRFEEVFIGYSGIGSRHVIAIDKQGKAWAWGSASSGQLGIQEEYIEEMLVPTLVKIDENVKLKKISLGGSTSLAIDEKGNIWAWGSNYNYQYGNGNNTASNIPIMIE